MIAQILKGSNPNLTPQEVEYCKFLQSGTHERKSYTPSGTCWYQRVGSNDHERVAILSKAHGGLMTSINKMKCEAEYAALFHDIKTNESQWFDHILSNIYNFNLLDGLAVTMGTYASLRRNRAESPETLEILNLAKRVLDLYQVRVLTPGLVHSCTSTTLAMILYNMNGLRYKQSGIWVNFLPQLKSAGMAYPGDYGADLASHYRNVIHFEIKYDKIDDDDSCYACGLSLLITNRRPTLADLEELSDRVLLSLLDRVHALYTGPEDPYLDTTLSKQAKLKYCAKCNKQEPTRGAFQCCSKCRVAHYCSRDCQLADWKARHKRDCKGK